MNEMTGPWQATERELLQMRASLLSRLGLATRQNAVMTRKGLVKHIQNQDLGWTKLKPAYLAYKKKKGLSTATLIATSQLMQSITTDISGDKLSAFVGVLRSSRRKDGEAPEQIAAIHEYGSPRRNIPARPLFQPTIKEEKQHIVERYRGAITEALTVRGKK